MITWKKSLLVITIIVALITSLRFISTFIPKTKSTSYTIVMVGDSMTERLGNSDEILAGLKTYYPNKNFHVLNYGFGSTNILSVQDRLEKETFHQRAFQPILSINFDLILIESFGSNPLSEFPLEEGLKKQDEALNKIVSTIRNSKPKAVIVFVATISPNTYKYAEGQVDLSDEKRAQWANERIAYIKNHITYADSHNIPIINVYQKSLDESGNGNIDYISSDDFIHPSAQGIRFISKEVADYLGSDPRLIK